MGNRLTPQALRYHAPVLVCLLAILVLIFLPTGFEGALLYQEAERCKAEVLSVDDSAIIDTGLVRSGEQRCQLEILDGAFAGQTVTGINMLNGSLEQDKIFAPGDVAQVVVSHDGDTVTNVTMTDHYRLGWEALMALGFAVFLILFAGRTGVRAIASFALTVLTLWKVLVPLYLKGWNPIWVGLAITLSGWGWPSPCSSPSSSSPWCTALTGGAGRRCPGPSWASWSPACWASCSPTCSRSTGR